MNVKILITGATGLIGSELVKRLLANQYEVNILTTSRAKILQTDKFKSFFWDPKLGIVDLKAFENVDIVVNLAGASIAKKWTKDYKNEILESRILSTDLLIKSIKDNKFPVKKFISTSAIGIYQSNLNAVYHENDTIYSNSFLGKVCQKWEKSAQKVEEINIPLTILRIGVVLSKSGGALEQMKNPIEKGFGAAISPGTQYVSWIHLEDLVSVFQYVIENYLTGTYNAVSPFPVTNKQLNQSIAKVLNKTIFLPNIPQFVIKLVLGEMHHLVTESQNVSAYKLLQKDFKFKYTSLENTLAVLLK